MRANFLFLRVNIHIFIDTLFSRFTKRSHGRPEYMTQLNLTANIT